MEFARDFETPMKRLSKAAEPFSVEFIDKRRVKSRSPGVWHMGIDARIKKLRNENTIQGLIKRWRNKTPTQGIDANKEEKDHYNGSIIPFSVIIPVMRSDGTMSKAGFMALVPCGAILQPP